MTKPIGPGEAARRLGVSTRTVQRWLREGKLKGVPVGDRLKVDPAALAGMRAGGAAVAMPRARAGDTGGRPIRRLLVANRGELVARIATTCRRLGIDCLALVPDDQARAWWARQTTEMVPLAGGYLDGGAVLDAARRAGADAIHPGYGFLAEDAGFAEAVVSAGLIWVGPPSWAMRALGDKAAGRRLAQSLGIPILAGYDDEDQHDDRLVAEADAIGYPVLVKPTAGGGGKGMHVARRADELTTSLGQARREALAAFGDERLILERYVEEPRHVEIQFLIDGEGDGVHLGERDCSLQRRHQKVVEESPSPSVDADLRARLGRAALTLVRAAGYVGAGTAEFLLDAGGQASFLEVNARLQVEHPVTELVTGRDLVADQLRIAAGEPLGITQDQVRLEGHAIEARIYAEDPWEGFLPAIGVVEDVRWPSGDGIRVDAGIGPGDVIGTRYDPLLAKVLVHAPTREEAIDRLIGALDRMSILGVTTNRGFLRWLLDRAAVRSGDATTQTIGALWSEDGRDSLTERAARAAAAGLAARADPSGVASGFRVNAPSKLRIRIGQDERTVDVVRVEPGLAVTSSGDEIVVDVDGRAYRAVLAAAPTVEAAAVHAQRDRGAAAVVAPMPGQVLAIRVAAGDQVEAGQTLLVLEAMKMENAVTAPAAARVLNVIVAVGQQVQRGEALVELS